MHTCCAGPLTTSDSETRRRSHPSSIQLLVPSMTDTVTRQRSLDRHEYTRTLHAHLRTKATATAGPEREREPHSTQHIHPDTPPPATRALVSLRTPTTPAARPAPSGCHVSSVIQLRRWCRTSSPLIWPGGAQQVARIIPVCVMIYPCCSCIQCKQE